MNKKLAFLSDLVCSFITILPGFATVVSIIGLFIQIYQQTQSLLLAGLGFLIAPFLFILVVWIIRLSLPTVKEGRYKMNFNKGFLAWVLNLALARSIRVFQLQDFVYSSYILKFLYWKAMGADIAFGINSSMYVNLVDLKLIKIEEGSMLGDEVQIGCHLIINNQILLKKVRIGKNSFIGINSKLGPGTTIGNNCQIGPWNFFMRNTISDGSKVEPFTYFQRNKK
jgi:hypothetical protein